MKKIVKIAMVAGAVLLLAACSASGGNGEGTPGGGGDGQGGSMARFAIVGDCL